MLRPALFGTTVLSATALLAHTASADVTAQDVWASYTAYYESTGAQVFGTPTVDGAITTVTDNALLYRFPMDFGTIRIALPNVTLTETTDGTVDIAYPDAFEVSVEVDIPSEGAGSMTLAISQENQQSTASGTPGDVTFVQSADAITISVETLNVPDQDFDFTLNAAADGYVATAQVVTGDLITTTSDFSTGETEIAYILEMPDGFVSSATNQYAPSGSSSEMALPATGVDLMNIAASLADGAYLRGTVTSEGSSGETVTTFGDDVLTQQSQTTGASASRFAMDTDGLDLFVEAADIAFNMVDQSLPFPIAASIGDAVIGYKLPLTPSDDPQDVNMRLDLGELEISEDLWAMFDAGGDLPRDPMSLNIDVAGTVISGLDLLNFETIEAQFDQAVPPISLETLTINEVSVNAIGATALATGAFTLDNTDTTTFDGFPRAEGSAILNVTGANTLIDRLVAFGVIGQEEAGMARLGMGFIARSTGDDAFETRLDVNPEGHVMVNGQRMR